jgi:cytochrome c biogenesis protein CcmG/thiol:disulfide interchange protein DsbE
VGIRILKPQLSTLLCLTLTLIATGCDRGSHPSEYGKPRLISRLQTTSTRSIWPAIAAGGAAQFLGQLVRPCIEELPSLQQFHHDHPEYPILAVSIDEDEDAYRRFLVQRHVDFTPSGIPKRPLQRSTTTGWPETFVIDRQGMIRRRFIGATDWSDPEIARFLKTL